MIKDNPALHQGSDGDGALRSVSRLCHVLIGNFADNKSPTHPSRAVTPHTGGNEAIFNGKATDGA